MKRGLWVVVIALLLGGCASAAKMENIAYQGEADSSYSPALQRNIAIGAVTGGQATNPLLTSKVSSAAFSVALQHSLMVAGLLNDGGRFLLSADIREASSPMAGVTMRATMRVEYTLSREENQEVVMQKAITSTGTATPKDAFLAATRQRIAMERSARNNVEALLETLSKVE